MANQSTNSAEQVARCSLRLSSCEITTILAALRHWQKSTNISDRKSYPHFDETKPLSNDEIDTLYEEINCSIQQQVIPFVLHDCGNGSNKIEGRIELWPTVFEVFVNGYGTSSMEPGCGSPIYIEFYQDSLRVLVWDDINQSDPTNVIALEGALETKRQDVQ